MNLWRQLRWRIIAAHMVVVIVGVTLVLSMASVITLWVVPAKVQEGLANLAATGNAEVMAQATADLLTTFRRSILTAVSVAAAGAIIAGIITSLLLARQILRPLRHIAQSSRRIADGRYDERVAVPTSDELGMVAHNFNQMAASLEQVEQQRVALIGNVSHELRTPLTGLKGYLEGLIDGLFPATEETFAQMYHEVRRMGRLVDDLQTLSRVEAGQISLDMQDVELKGLVERIVVQVQPQIQAKELTLVTELPPAAVKVCADADRIAQVLLNLLSNAIRYTPENGRVILRLTLQNDNAHIVVEDTGMGIPLQALPYLFERFYRVDPSRARASGGSGIGLTISRHLAWAMGGELTAASEGLHKGSTFTFTLPILNEG